jgi:hypothetical protein
MATLRAQDSRQSAGGGTSLSECGQFTGQAIGSAGGPGPAAGTDDDAEQQPEQDDQPGHWSPNCAVNGRRTQQIDHPRTLSRGDRGCPEARQSLEPRTGPLARDNEPVDSMGPVGYLGSVVQARGLT